jgi:hypothetical protein
MQRKKDSRTTKFVLTCLCLVFALPLPSSSLRLCIRLWHVFFLSLLCLLACLWHRQCLRTLLWSLFITFELVLVLFLVLPHLAFGSSSLSCSLAYRCYCLYRCYCRCSLAGLWLVFGLLLIYCLVVFCVSLCLFCVCFVFVLCLVCVWFIFVFLTSIFINLWHLCLITGLPLSLHLSLCRCQCPLSYPFLLFSLKLALSLWFGGIHECILKGQNR